MTGETTRRFVIEISLHDEFRGVDDETIANLFFDDLCDHDYGEYLQSIDTWEPTR